MKTLAKILIKLRYVLLAIMTVVTVICAYFAFQVEINTDMTEYLPDDSAMKIGLDLMEEIFGDTASTNTIRVMAEGLTDEEKQELLTKLEAIEYVDSVAYDDTEDYNIDDYTLYILSTEYDYNSTEELSIEAALEDDLAEYDLVYHTDDTAYSMLDMWIFVVAIAILLLILTAMCVSWIEPVIFIICIGFAVVINTGTNIVFGSVSYITNEIAAVLQLVLSMDYCVILMERYRQERVKTPDDNIESMTNALASSFKSILGSSVTTFVGLLAITFMRFKIGADLGYVLAKGVALSLLCTMTVLPALILLFDRKGLIDRLAKPVVRIPTGWLAKLSYRLRYLLIPLFILMFGGFYYLQNMTGIAYTLTSEDPIAEIFPTTDTLVVLYDTDDEDQISALVDELEEEDGVTMVLSYPNLFGTAYTSDELVEAIDDLTETFGMSVDENIMDLLDGSLIDLIYYMYSGGDSQNMTMSQFLTFLVDDILTNETFADLIDEDVSDQADWLSFLASSSELTASRSISSLSNLLGMDEDTVTDLLLYYYIENGGVDTGTMTLTTFINFLLDDVATDEDYSSMFDSDTLQSLQSLAAYTDTDTITTSLSASALASALGMDESMVNMIFMLYYGDATDATMSIYDFVSFIVNNLATNSEYAAYFDESTLTQLSQMYAIMSVALSGESYDYSTMASLLGMDSDTVRQLYLLYISEYGDTSSWTLSFYTLVNFLVSDVLTNENYADLIDDDSEEELIALQAIMKAVISGNTYSASSCASLLSGISDDITEDIVELLYLYYASTVNYDTSTAITIADLFEYIVDELLEDSRFTSFIDEDTRAEILSLKDELDEGIAMLREDQYSRLIIYTTLAAESDESTAFMDKLYAMLDELDGDSYVVGNMAMTYEMQQTFRDELTRITLLTALAIFIVVLCTFRSLVIPLLLVLIVQCGVFMTITVAGLMGSSIYYLALLIVECILMGATIDYGILFANYYRDIRREGVDVQETLKQAYEGSIQTILTSGLIMILVTAVLGRLMEDQTIAQIVNTVSLGALCAVLLILFVLPGLLAAFDRFIIRDKDKNKNKDADVEDAGTGE